MLKFAIYFLLSNSLNFWLNSPRYTTSLKYKIRLIINSLQNKLSCFSRKTFMQSALIVCTLSLKSLEINLPSPLVHKHSHSSTYLLLFYVLNSLFKTFLIDLHPIEETKLQINGLFQFMSHMFRLIAFDQLGWEQLS